MKINLSLHVTATESIKIQFKHYLGDAAEHHNGNDSEAC